MSNRFRQQLHSKITEKEEELSLSFTDVLRKEELENLRGELEETEELSMEEVEKFEARIEVA